MFAFTAHGILCSPLADPGPPGTDSAGRAGVRARAVTLRAGVLRAGVLRTVWIAISVVCVTGTPAFAIPSPDVVINIFSNAAQIVGLLSLAVGGALFSRRRSSRSGGRRAAGAGASTVVLRATLVALGTVVVVSITLNFLQWAGAVDEKNVRLGTNLVRSSTEAGKAVGDASLKTLKFSEQIGHPLGISTSELAELRGSTQAGNGRQGRDIAFIDVREPEELETGHLEGFANIRYPELIARAGELQLAGREPVLLCHSGNRSSELCIALAELGIDCKFVVGGFEKWLAEGRAASLATDGDLSSLRSLPPFPNGNVLLETTDVQELVSEERAIFVDVRYPKEFESRHLPNALNVPLRKLRTAAIETSLRQIPARPVIAPCYDKRSCFYAQILGLRLHRRGFDFRGRYTVPDEYSEAAAPKPHVEKWLEAQDGSMFAVIRQPFDAALSLARQWVGNLMLAILLVLAALRILLLPFTVKNERDQIIEQRVAPRLSGLKEKLKDDPRRLKSAIRALYRENGLTPTRNLIGLILQIVLLIAFFSAIAAVAVPESGAFLWIPDIGLPDPYFISPILLGGLIFLQLQYSAVKKSAKRSALRLLCAVLFACLTVQLNAALTLYLIFGLGLMVLQSFAVRFFMNRRRPASARVDKALPARIARLDLASRMPGVGAKAERTATMMSAGIPVPPGLVIPDAVFRGTRSGGTLAEEDELRLSRMCRRIGLKSMAVRSSGLGEDGEDHSYAGVFESVLNVDCDGLLDAVKHVRRSLLSAGQSAYGNKESTGGGVIVQQLVDAEYAGVLFTEHPMHSGAMLVEMTTGLGDKIANGTVEAETFTFGRLSLEPLDDKAAPISLKPLIELGVRAEKLFAQPQDIEWAYAKGRFYLLQSRNITRLGRFQAEGPAHGSFDQAIFEKERRRVLEKITLDDKDSRRADAVVLAENELTELLPRPTPMSLCLMESHWQPGGSVDMACRSLGVPYAAAEDAAPYLISAFGALYLNVGEKQRRSRKSLGPISSFRLSRAADRLEQDFLEHFLPDYLKDLRLLDATDFSAVGWDDLIGLFEDVWNRYCHETHVQVDIINIAADFYLQAAKRGLGKRHLSPGSYLGRGASGMVYHAKQLLKGMRRGTNTPEEFLALFGHRSDNDYELANPRYKENVGMIEQFVRTADAMSRLNKKGAGEPDLSNDPALALAVKRAQKFQNLKEVAKHYALRELAVIRRLLLELDRRLGLDGGIFYLNFAELRRGCRSADSEDFKSIVEERRAAARYFETLPTLPTRLTLRDLERLTPVSDTRQRFESSDGMHGILVAGDREVIGRARVLTDRDVYSVEDGEILVARYMHPNWTPVFPRIGGIVTEVGGWLSHTSILARECNITTIIGVKGAEYRLRTGDVLKLAMDGSIEVLERQPRETADETKVPAPTLDTAVKRTDEERAAG